MFHTIRFDAIYDIMRAWLTTISGVLFVISQVVIALIYEPVVPGQKILLMSGYICAASTIWISIIVDGASSQKEIHKSSNT